MPNSLDSFTRFLRKHSHNRHSTKVIVSTDYYGGVPVWSYDPETNAWYLIKRDSIDGQDDGLDDEFVVGLYGVVNIIDNGEGFKVWFKASFPLRPKAREGLDREAEFLGVFENLEEAKSAIERHNLTSRAGCLY